MHLRVPGRDPKKWKDYAGESGLKWNAREMVGKQKYKSDSLVKYLEDGQKLHIKIFSRFSFVDVK